MGRSSVDIIKSGGCKLSALEIENTLLAHPQITKVAVVGIADRTWGEAAAAAVALKGDDDMTLENLKGWCDGKLSSYKVPKQLRVVGALLRNAMSKVVKPSLKPSFEQPNLSDPAAIWDNVNKASAPGQRGGFPFGTVISRKWLPGSIRAARRPPLASLLARAGSR